MFKKLKLRSLSSKISIVVACIILGVVGSLTVLLYVRFQNIVEKNILESISASAEMNYSTIDNLLKRIEFSSDLIHDNSVISSDEDIKSSITKMIVEYSKYEEYDLYELSVDYSKNLELFNSYFLSCFGEDIQYNNVLFVSTDWPIHTYMPENNINDNKNGFSSDSLVKEQDWYLKAIAKSGEAYWFANEANNKLFMAKLLKLCYIGPRLTLTEKNIGVLLISIDASTLSQNLELGTLTSGGSILLLDNNDKVIYSSRNDLDSNINLPKLINTDFGHGEEVIIDDESYLMIRQKLSNDLYMVTLVLNKSIDYMIFYTIQIIIFAGIIMIIIAVILSIYFGRVIFSPLNEFANYMQQGILDDFNFDCGRTDELGTLYRSFKNLMLKLDETKKREMEAKEREKISELKTLQMQINPHFIYNTLNSISCLAMLNKQIIIADLIGNLVKIMRYNINNPDKKVTIAEEVEIIKQYECIQKSCYGDRISIKYDVSEETKKILIPKLIIQPLVENAIKHGMENKHLEIKLIISKYENNLIIKVWNNGKTAEIEEIYNYINGNVANSSDSLGVRNVYKRIKLECSDLANFGYKLDDNNNTLAEIIIPLDNSK